MNKQKIIDVLVEERALINGELSANDIRRCGHPGRCAIGALLFAAGMTDKEMRECVGTISSKSKTDVAARNLLWETYGIGLGHLRRIMRYNDTAEDSDYAEACGLDPDGAQWRIDRVRACTVIKHIEDM